MNAVNILLDKAKACRSLASDLALGHELEVSRQLVSQWRKGANPLSDERIAQLCKLAGENTGAWLVRVHAEQSSGQIAKEWQAIMRKLGAIAATIVVAVAMLLPATPARATSHNVYYVIYWGGASSFLLVVVCSSMSFAL